MTNIHKLKYLNYDTRTLHCIELYQHYGIDYICASLFGVHREKYRVFIIARVFLSCKTNRPHLSFRTRLLIADSLLS